MKWIHFVHFALSILSVCNRAMLNLCFVGVGDSGRFKDKTDFRTLTRVSYCQCRLRKVFGSVFRQFDWRSITLIMNRNDMHGLVLGTTLDVGLQKGGYYPYVIKYYGRSNPNLKTLLRQASSKSRGRWRLVKSRGYHVSYPWEDCSTKSQSTLLWKCL